MSKVITITDDSFGQVLRGGSGPLIVNPAFDVSSSADVQEPPRIQENRMEPNANTGVLEFVSIDAEGTGELFGERFVAFASRSMSDADYHLWVAKAVARNFTDYSVA